MIELNKIFKILPKDEKKNTVIFLILTLVITFLESFSIALVFPLIIFGLSDNINEENFYYLIEDYVKEYSNEELLFLLLFFLASVYVFKNAYLIYLHWWKHGFINRVQYKLEKKLLEIYLHQPFLQILKKNSAFKLRNIVNETSRFAKFLISTMHLFIEIMILIGITFVIFFLQPFAAFYVLILIFFIVSVFYIFAKIKTIQWSKKRIFHSGLSMKTLIESLSSIKEIKVFKKENFFIENFSLNNKKVLHFSRMFSTFNESPRIILEAASVLAITVAIVVMFNGGEEKKEILAMVGIFAAAGLRLLPSTSRIISSINEIKNNLPSIDLIIEEFKLGNESYNYNSNKNITDFNNEIKFDNVSFSYSDEKKPIIKDLSFSVIKGTVNAIVGQSGSGKSTILNLILGFVEPNKGKLTIDGKNIANKNFSKNFFGYVSQEILLLDNSVKFNISFGDENIDEVKLAKSIKVAQLENFITKLENGINTNIGEKGFNISGGQRQRIAIARAIYQSPKILILDEATSELDEENEHKIINDLIKLYRDKTIILTTHNKKILQYCNQILSLESSKIEKF